jgi:hypothetical protein
MGSDTCDEFVEIISTILELATEKTSVLTRTRLAFGTRKIMPILRWELFLNKRTIPWLSNGAVGAQHPGLVDNNTSHMLALYFRTGSNF